MGLLAYPFSRAKRIEFTGGYRNIGFAMEREQNAFLLSTGERIASQTVDLEAPASINLATAGTAFVHDTSVFGGVSPIVGSRYRIEGGVQAGGLNFGSLLADYRRYILLPRNLTLAGRAMHFGRYGGDSEDARLQDLLIGYPSLVRGYSIDSFDIRECGPELQLTGDCPAFDQLAGSKLAIGNVELRVPVLGALGTYPAADFHRSKSLLFSISAWPGVRTSAPAFFGTVRETPFEATVEACELTSSDFLRYSSVM
jgi:hypothetical protein